MADGPLRPESPEKPDLSDLQARIDRARGQAEPAVRSPSSGAAPSGLAYAFRLSSELIAGVIVGLGLGWFLDRALGTAPWGLVVFLLIGFGAGATNLVRAAARPAAGGKPPT